MMRRAELMPLPRGSASSTTSGCRCSWRCAASASPSSPTREAYDAAFEDDREFRRKVRTLAGNYQLFALMPALLSPLANPIWFETISHKVMRLVAPWLMLAAGWRVGARARWRQA